MSYYLYIKTHNITGLKYLGQTKKTDPWKYLGSGTYWKRHLAKHGKDISTRIMLVTDSKEELKETGIFFSKLFNIVFSEEWANLMYENGCSYGNAQMLQLKEGKHNWRNSELQRNIQLKRIANGTHNLLSKNRTGNTGRKRGSTNQKTKERNLGTDNPFRNNVPCVDINGKSCMISKDIYYNQSGIKDTWKYVHTKSKEARSQKMV